MQRTKKLMFTIEAKIRKEYGKGPSRRLRADNKLPAIIYGGKFIPISIELDHEKVWNMQKTSEFYCNTITIIIDDNEEKVRVQAIQRHAFKPKITHIDFIRV